MNTKVTVAPGMKLVKRFVKGPKPLWTQKDGQRVLIEAGESVMLPEHTAKSKAALLLTSAEFKANEAATDAALQAAKDEKVERDAPESESEPEPEKTGGGSKES